MRMTMSDPYSPEWLTMAKSGGHPVTPLSSPASPARGGQVPAVYPVVLWTLAFSIFAAPSAAMRGFKARANGGSAVPYWVAWISAAPGAIVAWFIAIAIIVAIAR
jgi:hypothetical protein